MSEPLPQHDFISLLAKETKDEVNRIIIRELREKLKKQENENGQRDSSKESGPE